ncbi:MAG: ADP-ribosyltransferase-containing protein [Candidatus Asgardarchaeia archaeon]
MNWYKKANSYIAYYGTPTDFQNFSYEFLGTNGTAEGFGFYFTSNKSIAEGYADGGILKKAILDIKKPLNFVRLSISKQNLAVFLRALDPTGEGYLSNWGESSYEGYQQVLNTAIEGEFSGSDNDVDLISGIIQAQGGDAESIYKVLKQTLGYDGIVVNRPSWGGNQVIYVVFDNSQIREI